MGNLRDDASRGCVVGTFHGGPSVTLAANGSGLTERPSGELVPSHDDRHVVLAACGQRPVHQALADRLGRLATPQNPGDFGFGNHLRQAVRAQQQAIAVLGYRANGLASSFRTQQSGLVGVFLRQQRTPFSSALGYAIESTMFDQGYGTLLCSTTGDADREESYVHSMIHMRAEGVIIRPTAATARGSGATRRRGAGV